MAFFSKSDNKSILLRLLIVAFFVYMLLSLSSLVGELAQGKATLAAIKQEIEDTTNRIDEQQNLLQTSTREETIALSHQLRPSGDPGF